MSTTEQDWPQTIDEAVDRLFQSMPEGEREQLRQMDKKELWELHFRLGLYIRNTFGLTEGNSALLRSCADTGHKIFHADDASTLIMEAAWERLQQESNPSSAS